jgi:hypothetical protein
MEQLPFSVYVKKTPLRTIFLVPPRPTTNDEFITDLIAYNQGKWGGRYNAIIQTDGHGLPSESDWKYLEFLDPDVIKSFAEIKDDLISKLDLHLSPYSIESPTQLDTGGFKARIDDEGISILPTLLNVRRAGWGFSLPTLVQFKLQPDTEPTLKDFITRNLGVLDNTLRTNQALEQVSKVEFLISDRASLAHALKELTSFKGFMYPAQLCALPTSSREHPRCKHDDQFTVVLGDTFADVLYAWNGIHLEPTWGRSHMRRIWLPKQLASDPSLKEPLARWIDRLADPGGSYRGNINFTSLSETIDDLKQITASLQPFIRIHNGVSRYEELGVEEERERRMMVQLASADLYRGTSKQEHFVLTEPDVEQGVMGGEHWMAEIYIELHQSINNTMGWLRLPTKNRLAATMFEKPSRIALNGIPRVLMKRGDPNLKLRLLPERAIFYYLLADPFVPYHGSDPRARLPQKHFDDVKPSDKGYYFSGLVDLFGDTSRAHNVFESRYWRTLFDILSRNTFSQTKKLIVVRNKLKKKITRNPPGFLSSEPGVEWISNYVIQLSKEHAGSGKEVQYSQFLQEAKKEIADFNAQHSGQDAKLDEDELKDSITDLIDANILQLGIRPACQRCGFREWFHLNEASQSLKCKGCGTMFPIRAEEAWFYRLNTLVQAAHATHGLTPVILVLGQLMRFTNCFIVSPCLALYDNDGGEPYSDLDILCISDGRLIIGEVKQTNGLFEQSDFEVMTDIARRVRPYKVIFSSMESEPTRFIKAKIQKMTEELNPLHVEVEWYRLSGDVFSAKHYF